MGRSVSMVLRVSAMEGCDGSLELSGNRCVVDEVVVVRDGGLKVAGLSRGGEGGSESGEFLAQGLMVGSEPITEVAGDDSSDD